MIGVKDIARIAGVSPATVSNVINGRSNVGEATKERVLEICRENGYNPNPFPRGLKSGSTRTLLFTFSDFERSFYLDIIHGIHDYAEAHDYDLLICTGKFAEKYMDPLVTSGCIALDGSLDSDLLDRKARRDYPMVVLDRLVDNEYIKSILVNNFVPMYDMVSRLIDRGCRRFSFLGGKETSSDNRERFEAFQKALSDKGITFTRDRYIAGEWGEESGRRAAQILMLTLPRPEVLVCANDNMAIGAIKVFRENGLDVGKDILVTGFDNSSVSLYYDVTTIDIPDYERGYLAAQALVGNIESEEPNTALYRINAKVLERGSAPLS